MTNAFEALGRKFRVIDMKYNNGEGETKRNDLVVVSNDVQPDEPVTETQDEPVVETQSETDQGEELSGKIADLNDQFRSCTSLSSNEFNGEWIYGDDIKALPPTTKAAIKKKIREYPLDQFTDCPLHDRGRFVHETKKDSFTVIWMIKVYQDDMMLAEAEHPDDPAQSYRTLAVALSDQPDEG
ncbi:MAG: hypothetical protein AAFR39_08050, partial [Pseudomonadota bacterium]